MITTERIEVHGAVQGVGFRPRVFRLATELGIRGDVRNVGGHVVITASGLPGTLSAFRQALRERAPRHARIDNIIVTPHENAGHTTCVAPGR